MWRRLSAVIVLFFLSPLVAEYLLGSLPMSMIAILPVMAAMYGAGAVLIREIARRCGGGWVSIILLATAYGLIEEGLVTQSLFNPNYLHLRLLDFGFIPALGTGLPWLIFVVSIHVIWSISVPISLTGALFPRQRNEPWLGGVSAAILTLIFLAGCAMIASFTYKSLPFMATPMQFAGTGLAIIILVAAAFIYPRFRAATTPRPAPATGLLLAGAFICGSLFMLVEHIAAQKLHWSWQVCTAAMLGIEAVFVVALALLSRGRTWTALQAWGLMAGGLMVYVVFGFLTDNELHGTADLPAHAAIAVAFVALCAFAGYRSRNVLTPVK